MPETARGGPGLRQQPLGGTTGYFYQEAPAMLLRPPRSSQGAQSRQEV